MANNKLKDLFIKREEDFNQTTLEIVEQLDGCIGAVLEYLENNGRQVEQLSWQDISLLDEDGKEPLIVLLGTLQGSGVHSSKPLSSIVHLAIPYDMAVRNQQSEILQYISNDPFVQDNISLDSWLSNLQTEMENQDNEEQTTYIDVESEDDGQEVYITKSTSGAGFKMDELTEEQRKALSMYLAMNEK